MAALISKTVEEDGNGDYTSLEACMAANEQDLVANDKYLEVQICGTDLGGNGWDNADARVSIDTYVTDATRDVLIYCTASAKHQGSRPSAPYYRIEDAVNYKDGIKAVIDYLEIRGVSCKATGTSGNGIEVAAPNAASLIILKDCFAYDCAGSGFNTVSANTIFRAINCIAVGNGSYGFYIYASTVSAYAYHCVSCANVDSGFWVGAYDVLECKNCYAGGNGTDYAADANGTLNTTNCHDSDGSANTTTAYSVSAGCYFANVTAGSEDFNIGANSELIEAGTDLQPDPDEIYDVEDDYEGNARDGTTPDVGADEYVGAPPVGAAGIMTPNTGYWGPTF